MAAPWPVTNDVLSFLRTRGYEIPDNWEHLAQVDEAVGRAITRVQRLCRKTFTLQTIENKAFPSSGTSWLFCGWMQEVTNMYATYQGDLRAVSHPYSATVIAPEWETLPSGETAFRRIALADGSVFPPSGVLYVSGVFGYSDGPPDEVFHAVELMASADVAPMSPQGKTGPIVEWRARDRTGERYESGASDHPVRWREDALSILQIYQEPSTPLLRRPHGKPGGPVSLQRTTPH